MGVVLSGTPFIPISKEHKVHASADTGATIINSFGSIYDAFLREPFNNLLSSYDAQNYYNSDLENIAYKAPNFRQGTFAISVFDFYKNQNFSKKIKLGYPNGTIEYKTIKHGEQLTINQTGILIDLDPDGSGDLHYVSQQLLNSNAGIALTNWQKFYLKKANQTSINLSLLFKFYPQANPLNVIRNKEMYFNNLNSTKKAMATITSETISATEFSDNYERLNTQENLDQTDRMFTFSLDS